jgi:transposase InsO family protein
MKYISIRAHESAFGVSMMCRVLNVSRSGYYDWRNRKLSKRFQANQVLDAAIVTRFHAHKSRYGAPRLARQLRNEGWSVTRKRVAGRMRHLSLRAKAARKYKATTNSRHSLPVAPNVLNQDFEAQYVNQKYVSDITYVWTEEGWLYVAVVLDLYSRKVVGWSIAERMNAALVCNALKMALWRRKMPKGVIVHSDRGSQYCSKEYQSLINANELICSMSKKGDCYDNGAMESWNHSFKVEAIHGERFITRQIARAHIFEYIEIYYNRQRIHSTLGYLTPSEFEVKNVA